MAEVIIMKKNIGVIGLGRFGSSIAKTLTQLGHEVLALDNKEEKVDDIRDYVTSARVVEYDIDSLKEAGVSECEVVVVAIGHSIKQSILITLLLQELGVGYIIARSIDDLHEKALEKIGANRVVNPEKTMGMILANQLISSDILEYFEVSPDYSVQEVQIKPEYVGKSLADLNLRKKEGWVVLAIKRSDKMIALPTGDEIIEQKDTLIVLEKTNL